MPRRKETARPAEAGWLLEVGALGIDKTLKLMRWGRWTLLEVEWLLRGVRDYPKTIRKKEVPALSADLRKLLPWADIPACPVNDPRGMWGLSFGLMLGFEEEAVRRKGAKDKSRPSNSPYRRPLHSWRLSTEDALLVASPAVEGKIRAHYDPGHLDQGRGKRIKACSVLLSDALQVLAGRRRSLRSCYSAEIESTLRKIPRCREKVRTIVRESLENESSRWDAEKRSRQKWGSQNGRKR